MQIPSSVAAVVTADPVPTPIKIIAGFLLFGAVFFLLCLFLPFPAFLLGFIIPPAAHILYLPFAALASFAGYGLLRLKEPARLLTMAFLILGVCPAALAVLPWYQSQLQTYTARVIRLIPSMPGQTPPPVTYSSPLLFFSCIMGLILHGFVFWLLHRHRAAFQAPAPTSEPILEA